MHWSSNCRRFVMVAALIAPVVVAAPLSAESVMEETSLSFIPADASIYLSSLRLKEQWDLFASSRAYARLRELPFVQQGIQELRNAWEDQSNNDEMAPIMKFIEAEENRDLLALGCDLMTHEVFAYGDENVAGLFSLLLDMNQQMSQMQWEKIGEGGKVDEDEVRDEVVDKLIDALEDMEVPRVVWGFRTTMSKTAISEMDRLQKILDAVTEQVPELRGRLKRTQDSGADLLTLRIDPDVIPWEKLLEENEDMSDQLERLRDALADREVAIALGVYRDYVLLMFGPDTDVDAVFEADDRLSESDKFARLRKFDAKRITSISYVSEEFARSASNTQQSMDQLRNMAETVVPLMELDEDDEADLIRDARELVGDLESFIPEPGAMVSFSYLTKRGFEGYTENWAENLYLDATESLDILNHVGGDPTVVIAGNAVRQSHDLSDKWMTRAGHYVENLLLKKQLDDDQWELYESFREALLPLVKQYRDVTKNHWNKAFDSGQFAFVMDSKLEPKTMWHLLMPPASSPLPMLELGLVYPLADRKELETAFDKYRETNESMLETVKELLQEHREELKPVLKGQAAALPGMIESFKMPVHEKRKVEDGVIVYDTTLQKAMVDSALAPCVGWNSVAYVLALSPQTAERLLEITDVEGPLSKAAGNKLASASYVNFERLVGFFRPWVSYGFELASAQADEDEEQIEEIGKQVDSVLEVLQCFEKSYSITFDGDGSLVSHFRADFKDLEE